MPRGATTPEAVQRKVASNLKVLNCGVKKVPEICRRAIKKFVLGFFVFQRKPQPDIGHMAVTDHHLRRCFSLACFCAVEREDSFTPGPCNVLLLQGVKFARAQQSIEGNQKGSCSRDIPKPGTGTADGHHHERADG